jgi:hypothetical protein
MHGTLRIFAQHPELLGRDLIFIFKNFIKVRGISEATFIADLIHIQVRTEQQSTGVFQALVV